MIRMATTKAYLNIKIDKGVKETAAQILESMGIDHTLPLFLCFTDK
jgi:antitoxin component of RelBE/YafQ-DinJ toxin-antitoxin module